MRAWCGEEKEGVDRQLTLYVESDAVDYELAKQALSLAKKNGCTRVYLGAGRVNIETIDPRAVDVFAGAAPAVSLVVETSIETMPVVRLLSKVAKIIVRFEVPGMDMADNIALKIDNMQTWCAVADRLVFTDISQLDGGMYPTDREVL